MRQALRILLTFYAALPLTVAVPALAQGTPAMDFSVEILQGLPVWTPPGSTGTFLFRVTNLGPDDSVEKIFVGGSLPGFDVPPGLPVFMTSSADPGDACAIHATTSMGPGPSTTIFYTLIDFLAAGESVTCELAYTVTPDYPFLDDERIVNGGYPVEWTIYTFSNNDPDPDNNTVLLPFRFLLLGHAVPALGPWGLALLALALASAGWVVLRRSAG